MPEKVGREALFFPALIAAALLDPCLKEREAEIGPYLHPRICRPSTIELATVGRIWGADWDPAWRVVAQRTGRWRP
jgi:hypothetical protein